VKVFFPRKGSAAHSFGVLDLLRKGLKETSTPQAQFSNQAEQSWISFLIYITIKKTQ